MLSLQDKMYYKLVSKTTGCEKPMVLSVIARQTLPH
jgi:hypothetical protein